MGMVTLSHEIGTDGPDIGRLLAQRLDFRYVDQELIAEAARRYGCPEDKLSQLGESKPSLFERLDAETRRLITVIQTVLLEFADGDRVILMGRGGQWLLRGIPHVLRVRLMAPFELRVRRLAEKVAGQGGKGMSLKAVAQMIRRDDSGKIGRMRYLFEVDLHDPALYDVTINTEALSSDATVALLAELLQRPEYATTAAGRQLVADRVLASRVQVALVTHPDTRRHDITVEAARGVVTLEGAGGLDEAIGAAHAVPGVREVRLRQAGIPPMPPFIG